MNKSILSALILGTSTLMWSAGAMATTSDPVTDVWVDSTNAVVGSTNAVWEGGTTLVSEATDPMGLLAVKHHHMYVVTDLNTGTSKEVRGLWHVHHSMLENGCMNTVFPGICNGVKYTITDTTTGKQYMVVGVKKGTMDVMHGTKTIRYQYVVPMVRPM